MFAWRSLGHEFRVVVHIAVWTGADRVAVPLGALFRSDGQWAVFRVADGRARLQTVQLGERNSEHAEVTGGLQPGDTVVLHPSDRVADGVGLRIVAGPDQG
jgi:HlyD family secretion protein